MAQIRITGYSGDEWPEINITELIKLPADCYIAVERKAPEPYVPSPRPEMTAEDWESQWGMR